MMRSMFGRAGVVIVALFAFTAPALAGGMVVVTLDALPEEPRAGETLRIGFMVRQHGVTPNDQVEPVLSATHTETGDTLRSVARKEGAKGHYVVEVRFPSAGTWEWEITPEPYPTAKLGQVTILPAVTIEESNAETAAETTQPAVAASTLRWAGGLLLVAAIGLALLGQRAAAGRRRALPAR